MSITTTNLNYSGIVKAVKPSGVNDLKVSYNKETGSAFHSRKLTGSLRFSGIDLKAIEPLSGCCQKASLDLYRPCDTVPVLSPILHSKNAYWNYSGCYTEFSELQLNDLYTGVYKYWQKGVNMLTLPADLTIVHNYQKQQTVNGEVVYSYSTIPNNRFRSFNKWVFYLIQQTFKGTEYESIIPQQSAYSEFFTRTINPITNRSNIFLKSGIVQASDMATPDSSNSATGVLLSGQVNESMTVNLKNFLENIFSMFDCRWFIDPSGKFRIEHNFYFENGLSYEAPNITLDLTLSKYEKYIKSYRGSYKTDTSNLYGVQEIVFQTNQALNQSQYAFEYPYEFTTVLPGFTKINDFDFGNIRYDTDCANRDEKGEVAKDTRNVELFYTFTLPVWIGESSIDLKKWFLVEYQTDSLTGVAINTIKKATVERRNIADIENGNYSATSLMRDFHRHARPFANGLMNYNDDVPNQKGIYRQMYSVMKTKIVEKIAVPFCCNEQSFKPYGVVKMPDGGLSLINTAEYTLKDDMVEIELITDSACGGVVITPDPGSSTGNNPFPPAGTLLSSEDIEYPCEYWINEPGGPYRTELTPSVRNWFADGYGGKYYVDVNPCIIY